MEFFFTCFFSSKTRSILLLVLGCFWIIEAGAQCPVPVVNDNHVNQETDSSAVVNWPNVNGVDSFLVEYGPAGFPAGAGVFVGTSISGITLDSLNPCVDYDVYVYSVCDDEISAPGGPASFSTTTDAVCTYTFILKDVFGDGWNGAYLLLEYNRDSVIITLQSGSSATIEFDAYSSVPICISYFPGQYENEVSFDIIDPNGLNIYSDGPMPMTGNILNTVACEAPCPAPKVWRMADVNATNATTAWQLLPGQTSGVFLEYGPMGFTRGTGTVVNVPPGQLSYKMTGLQEKTWYNVYLGVDCGGDSSKVIGPLMFQTLWLVDVGIDYISPNADDFCNLGNETITVGLRNYGQAPQTLFEFYFAVNGVQASIPIPQDGLFTGVVGNDSTQLIDFETMWDFSKPGYYVIEAWTQLEGDSDLSNDTFLVEFLNAFPKPVREDFEDLAIPDDWTVDNQFFPFFAPGAHNNPTAVFGSNLYSSNPEVTLTTGRIGPVAVGDTLFFDYRFADWPNATDPTILEGDSLIVQISDDCEESYHTILVFDSSNHVPTAMFTTVEYPLDDYDGKTIHVRFIGKWAVGDFWFDLDNINIQGTCPAGFGSLVDIEGSFDMDSTGSVTITPIAGTGPYIFVWSTGDEEEGDAASLEDLPAGAYSVDITDAEGCMETVVFEIGTLVAADEVFGVEAISVYPNPTTGLVNLSVDLTNAMDIQTRIMDLSGRVLIETRYATVVSLQEQLDLSSQPNGLYIIQIVADGKPYYAKLMVTR